jgi:protein gp37
MAENTKIEWTDHTVNLWWGCTKVNAGCDNCYAEHLSDTRYKNDLWGEGVPRKAIKSALPTLSKLQAKAADRGVVETVFMSSMCDIFEKSKPLIDHKGVKLGLTTGDLRNELFFNIGEGCYPNLIFLFLTKRPSNINKMVPAVWLFNPPDNVVFGASVANQQAANDVARHFKGVTGKKFLSVEPMLGKIGLSPFVDVAMDYNKAITKMLVDWVIVGGESGDNKRPFDPNWARIIKGFCSVTKTPFFMKQWDKVQPIPDDLMIREFPEYLIDAKPPSL